MKRPRPPIVTLTTDFGLADPYVAEMKGRLLTLAPQAVLVDISHEVPPFAVDTGAYVLERAAAAFPPGTVHVAVVDPGVGGSRRGLAVDTGGARYVGPDNGVLEPFLDGAAVHELTPGAVTSAPIAPTFHGRDLFAPAAAHLASGGAAADLGPAVDDPVRRAGPADEARVIHVDRFGNAVTSLRRGPELDRQPAVEVAGQRLETWVRTYAEAPPDRPVLLLGSSGRLEIALREDSAARRLGLAPGTPLRLIIERTQA